MVELLNQMAQHDAENCTLLQLCTLMSDHIKSLTV